MANSSKSLYRVVFADQSSRDYIATDVESVTEALQSRSNPITAVQLVRANVQSDSGNSSGDVIPVMPVQPACPPWGPYPPGPFPPGPGPGPHPHPIPPDRPVIYTNRLMLSDISQLYQPLITFGAKTPEAYRADFVELRRAKSVYQFSVPAYISGGVTVITGLVPDHIHFDEALACSIVQFTSFHKEQDDVQHQWLTTLKIFIDHIEGGSIDVTGTGAGQESVISETGPTAVAFGNIPAGTVLEGLTAIEVLEMALYNSLPPVPPGTVDTPTAVPTDHNFQGSVNVSLSCNTAGAEIHYTLDGSTPNVSSQIYTAPITLFETTVIKAMAAKTGMSDSGVLTVTYTKQDPPGPSYYYGVTQNTAPIDASEIQNGLLGTGPKGNVTITYNGVGYMWFATKYGSQFDAPYDPTFNAPYEGGGIDYDTYPVTINGEQWLLVQGWPGTWNDQSIRFEFN